MAQTNSFYQPDKDAGWGLIFRLNDLWSRVDLRSVSGDYAGWELTLDSIFRNLLYRNEMEVIVDDNEKITDVEPSKDDVGQWKVMKKKIKQAKFSHSKAMRNKDVIRILKAKEDYYYSLFFYDIWLRKFMQLQGLYLKEFESNPSKALFGGAFKKKRGRGG